MDEEYKQSYDDDYSNEEYDYRGEIPEDCRVSTDGRCGPSAKETSCSEPGQYCDASGQCQFRSEKIANSQSEYNYLRERACNVSKNQKCGENFGNTTCPHAY